MWGWNSVDRKLNGDVGERKKAKKMMEWKEEELMEGGTENVSVKNREHEGGDGGENRKGGAKETGNANVR